jgi:hypothetical protein
VSSLLFWKRWFRFGSEEVTTRLGLIARVYPNQLLFL